MDRDLVSEATPKRRKLTHDAWDSENDDGDELFQNIGDYDTIDTLPLPSQQRGLGPSLPITQLVENIKASNGAYVTQPTQPLSGRSSNSIQVPRSSPDPPSSPGSLPHRSTSMYSKPAGSVGASMAPPGTTFRQPPGVQGRPAPKPVVSAKAIEDLLEDPPIELSSDEDDADTTPLGMKPTAFTRSGRTVESSPARVQDSPNRDSKETFKALTSNFAYSSVPQNRSSDAMSSAYGSTRRVKKPAPRQTGPARAQPVQEDMSINDILDIDLRRKVTNLKIVYGVHRTIRDMHDALLKKHGNYDDALNLLAEQGEEDELATNNARRQQGIDLTSSDIESGKDKAAARVSANPAKRMAKQEVKAPARTIQEKYSSTQARPTIPKPAVTSQEEPAKPRRRLVQRRRQSSSPAAATPPPSKPGNNVIHLDSDSDMDSGASSEQEEEAVEDSASLLGFFNSCTAKDLADLGNEKEAVAEFIISKRPFKSLDAIRKITDAQPTKSGRRSARKAIGEKVLDVCEQMWDGYEAVDQLVEKCELLGKPIAATMKKWGLDLNAAAKDGELALTKLEDPAHDSGIGTPCSSTMDLDDDVLSPIKASKKGAFLKQPSSMSLEDVIMKDYQLVGLNWLNLLWSKRLSCILADDMGLGKTCQVIAFLAHLKETEVDGVHLVIVPGSTLENWLREFQRFCPTLHVEPYYGSMADREVQRYDLRENMDNIDVIVTTYDTAVGRDEDVKFLRKVRPTVCVFDEGHTLKNSTTKRHQQLMRISADFRLLLTGTPLQNNLQELASLLGFILPSVFNEKRAQLENIFKYKASTKDADHAALLSAQRITRARSMMTPFILRRKKQQVLREMPAKHCRVEYCEMSGGQRDLYADQRQAAILAHEEKEQRAARSTHHMMRLRQAALHPLLLRNIYDDEKLKKLQKILLNSVEYGGNPEELVWKLLTVDTKGGDFGLHRFCVERADYIPSRFQLRNDEWMDSGKVKKLRDLLDGFVANGDKVLLFSQFTSMMDILEAVFETLSIKFMRLDGNTNMTLRQDMIDQFSTDETIPVFMLSTKAGGAGINLACANKVIIFDSSFNPQEDIQAENRAHRVGQTREVEVVRLVTRGTIEEQIHALGVSKLALDARVSGEGGSAVEGTREEGDGEKLVEKMFFDSINKKEEDLKVCDGDRGLKDEFKQGLRGAGLKVEDDRRPGQGLEPVVIR